MISKLESIWNRFTAPIPKILKKIQYISGSAAILSAIVMEIKDKYPDFVIPNIVMQSIVWLGIINIVVLQFLTHKDFEK